MHDRSPITSDPDSVAASTQPTMGLPDAQTLEQGQLVNNPFGLDPEASRRLAVQIMDGHRDGKDRYRDHNLKAEKYLLHMLGEQWYEIKGGTRLEVPPNLNGGLRLQDNLEDVLVRHSVAQLTGQQFHVQATSKADRQSRDRARVDTLFANEVIRRQNLNHKVADALWFAAPYGCCPIHVTWRYDFQAEAYEPIYDVQGEQYGEMRRGYADLYLGDPWDTVYNEGAKRTSVEWFSYGRVLPITLVQETLGGNLPDSVRLHGRDDLPSASRVQRIARKWHGPWGDGDHQLSVDAGMGGGDELIAIICREIEPGVLRDWPEGQLAIVALNGTADTDRESIAGSGSDPVLLHLGPLPGAVTSATRVYMNPRGDDVKGRPYLEDIDADQVQLNQFITLRAEWARKFARPPLAVGPGGLADDTVTIDDDAILEYTSERPPSFLYPPSGANPYQDIIEDLRNQMFRKGGWQAASRGESHAGDSGAKVIALARADDTIFAPLNRSVRQSVCEILQTAHALAREYMTTPQAVTAVTGDDLSYLAKPYITAHEMSPEPPQFEVVNGFGATPEAMINQLLQLFDRKLLDEDKFWKLYPDATIRPPEVTSDDLKRTRALRRNAMIEEMALGVAEMRQQNGQAMRFIEPNLVQQAVQRLADPYTGAPIRLTDDPMVTLEVLDMIVQDDDSDPFAVAVAEAFQQQVFQRLQQAQMPPASPGGPAPQGPNAGPKPRRIGPGPAGPPEGARPPGPQALAGSNA